MFIGIKKYWLLNFYIPLKISKSLYMVYNICIKKLTSIMSVGNQFIQANSQSHIWGSNT